jgi:hypothetical protein
MNALRRQRLNAMGAKRRVRPMRSLKGDSTRGHRAALLSVTRRRLRALKRQDSR